MSSSSPSIWRSPLPRRPAPSAAPTPVACAAGTPAGSRTCLASAGACGSASLSAASSAPGLTERGFKGSYGSVYAFVTKRLGAAGKKRERLNAATPQVPRPPSARQLSFERVRRPEKRKHPEQARLDAIRGRSVELAEAPDLADGFANLIRKQSTGTLSEWLTRCEASPDPALRRFAEGIRSDEAPVQAAVTQRWSNGPAEGHVNRLKTIKRRMYGRAGFVLLRARVLNAA
jgi:transposase